MNSLLRDLFNWISPKKSQTQENLEDKADEAGVDQYKSLAEGLTGGGELKGNRCKRGHLLLAGQRVADCFNCYLIDLSRRERGLTPKPADEKTLVGALLCLKGFHQGTVFPVVLAEDVPLTIGADPNCDIVLSDERISRRHLTMVRRQGRTIVRDLNSLFHSAMRGENELQWYVLDPEREYWFLDGFHLVLGDVEFLFRATAEQPNRVGAAAVVGGA